MLSIPKYHFYHTFAIINNQNIRKGQVKKFEKSVNAVPFRSLYRDSAASARIHRIMTHTLFRMIFREPGELLKLYNAVNGTDYRYSDDLKIVTLENAIYMNMKNDLAFIIDCRMSLYEHQASVNPNIPLRDLFYVAKEYQGMVEPMEKCPLLAQYSQYVSRVQEYASGFPLEEAVENAVDECIREGILADFLRKNKAEAIAVSIFEYDEEKELALFRAAEREEGLEQGILKGREQGLRALIDTLKEFCTDSDEIYTKVTKNPIYVTLTREEFDNILQKK